MNYQQQTLAVMNSLDLVVALYDGMIRFLHRAIANIEAGEAGRAPRRDPSRARYSDLPAGAASYRYRWTAGSGLVGILRGHLRPVCARLARRVSAAVATIHSRHSQRSRRLEAGGLAQRPGESSAKKPRRRESRPFAVTNDSIRQWQRRRSGIPVRRDGIPSLVSVGGRSPLPAQTSTSIDSSHKRSEDLSQPTRARYFARQPILDRNKQPFGYEFLFRAGKENRFCISSPAESESATRLMVDNSVMYGFESLARRGKHFSIAPGTR